VKDPELPKHNFDQLMRTVRGHRGHFDDTKNDSKVHLTVLQAESNDTSGSIQDLRDFRLQGLQCRVRVEVEARPEEPKHDLKEATMQGVTLIVQGAEAAEKWLAEKTDLENKRVVAKVAKEAGLESKFKDIEFHSTVGITMTKGGNGEAAVEVSIAEGQLGPDAAITEADAKDYVRQSIEKAVQVAKLASEWRMIKAKEIKKAKGTARYHQRSTKWDGKVPGENRYIRQRMDYSYFVQVTDDRLLWQDEMIRRELFTAECMRAKQRLSRFKLPWVVYSAGGMGAGKGYVTNWMNEKGYLPKANLIGVDPDAIRKMLPEWDALSNALPEEAGYLTQMEATNIGDIVAKKALANRFCVFIDGSLRATDWYKNTEFPLYRKLFPGIRVMIIHVLAEPEEECINRAVARAKTEGRAVPASQVQTSISDSARSVSALAPEADFVIRVVNRTGQEPELRPVEGEGVNPTPDLLKSSGGWELLKECFEPLDKFVDRVASTIQTKGRNMNGLLTKETLQAAIAKGVLTERVVKSIDTSGDGGIFPDELDDAKARARDWGEAYDHRIEK